MNKIYISIAFIFLIFSTHISSSEETNLYFENTFGSIGLIQNPTARFSDDGEFTFGISQESPYKRIYAKMQFFPWMESVLRYTEGTHIPYQPGLDQTWKDKGLDFKFRLLEETKNIPALAIGFQDIGGTASYSSEYLVATKRIGSLDFTLGLGWGRLGGKDHINNPLEWLTESSNSSNKQSGVINFNRFFNDDYTSIFGGIEYLTPVPNLSVKLEYDTSNYSDLIGKYTRYDQTGDILQVDSSMNIGLSYQIQVANSDTIDFSMGYIRGNTIYANIAIHSNLNSPRKQNFTAPKEIINIPYLEPFAELDDEWKKYLADLIMWQMGNVGFVTHRLIFNENELQVEISQGRFRKPIQAFDLAARILANNSPKNITKLTIINIDQGVETLRASISRDALVESAKTGPMDERSLLYNNFENINTKSVIRNNEILYPNFYWEIKPHLLGTLQHQEKFYFYQLEALFHSEYSIKKGLYLTTDIGVNIYDNYDDYSYHIPDGELYHVRQDRRLYLTEGRTGLRRMALDYLIDFNSSLKAKISAGYLEWMYGGIGGEILYHPENKNWALGLDAYWVKLREFDQKFSFRDYDTVTGFLTFYYDIPFYDLRFKSSLGKFLGKDEGVLLDLSRRFTSGARVGASAAFTDCNARCVGEGSFNKWIYFTLPMDMFYVKSSTRGTATYGWSPLTKDAGTKVEPGGLYNLVVNAKDEVDVLRRKQWSIKNIVSGFSTRSKTRD